MIGGVTSETDCFCVAGALNTGEPLHGRQGCCSGGFSSGVHYWTAESNGCLKSGVRNGYPATAVRNIFPAHLPARRCCGATGAST